MGNCQAAEAATVVIQRPGGAVQRIYWSVSANEVMASNPGHYVAVVTVSARSENGVPVKQLKLLRPDDTLHIGHVYRLISFEGLMLFISCYTDGFAPDLLLSFTVLGRGAEGVCWEEVYEAEQSVVDAETERD